MRDPGTAVCTMSFAEVGEALGEALGGNLTKLVQSSKIEREA